MEKRKVTRREFIKKTGAGSAAIWAMAPCFSLGHASIQESRLDRGAVFAALGDTLIPTDPGDPGYRSLEPYKITEEVMRGLAAVRDADLFGLPDDGGPVRRRLSQKLVRMAARTDQQAEQEREGNYKLKKIHESCTF